MKTGQIPLKKPKTPFQTQLALLQTLAKHPSRSKTPPNLQKLPLTSQIHVNTTANFEESDSEGEKTAKNCEKPEIFQANGKKKPVSRGFLECNSNSSRRIPKKVEKCARNHEFLRLSLENNKNLAWNEISKLLNNTHKKPAETQGKPEENPKKLSEFPCNFAKNPQIEPKCLVKSSLNFENTKKPLPQQGNLLRKSLNYREDLENVPVVHENFESLVNNYVKNVKNNEKSRKEAKIPINLRHSCEGLTSVAVKTEENEKIQSLDGNFVDFLGFYWEF